MKNLKAAFLLFLLAVGCASNPPLDSRANDVIVMNRRLPVCDFLGSFYRGNSLLVQFTGSSGNQINLVKSEAANRNANVVYTQDTNRIGTSNSPADMYYCPEVRLQSACDADDGESCLKFAEKLGELGKDQKSYADHQESMLKKACKLNQKAACDLVAKTEENDRKAKQAELALNEGLKRKCNHGSGDACYAYGWRLANVYDDEKEALFYAKRACDLKNVEACKTLFVENERSKERQIAEERWRSNEQIRLMNAQLAEQRRARIQQSMERRKKTTCNSQLKRDFSGQVTGSTTVCD